MPINLFGNSSHDNNIEIDTSLFVQKSYKRTNYIESDKEEDIDLKNQYRIKNLPDPISIREPAPKHYVDFLINDPCIIKNTAHIDLNEINISSLKKILINNHTEANRGLIRGHLPLQYLFSFARSFIKITKGLGFELDLRTPNRKQDVLYTT